MLNANINNILTQYLAKFAAEADELGPLLKLLENGASVVTRQDFAGHVTCGAIVLGQNGQVLMVHHRALDKWLFPGGHLEVGDSSLRDAALRELAEETGVPKEALTPFNCWLDEIPIHIDRHLIPRNAAKREPDHYHYDFRFLFRSDGASLAIQEDEVFSAEWTDSSHAPFAITERLKTLGLIGK